MTSVRSDPEDVINSDDDGGMALAEARAATSCAEGGGSFNLAAGLAFVTLLPGGGVLRLLLDLICTATVGSGDEEGGGLNSLSASTPISSGGVALKLVG